jgi:polar amino acid transport system permease protein
MDTLATALTWAPLLLEGALVTIGLALATLPFGLALGLLVALAVRSRNPLIRAIGTLYTTLFRGIPELLTLYLVISASRSGCNRPGAALVCRANSPFRPLWPA